MGANGVPTFAQHVTLSPQQQKLLDQQQRQDINIGNTENGLVNQIGAQQPLSTAGLPGLQSFAQQSPLQMNVNTPGYQDAIKQAQDATYNQAASYLDPQYKQQSNQLTAQLANQGITQGSEAWKNAWDQYNRDKTFSYNQAQDSAVQNGNALQNQLFGQDVTKGQFANEAAGQQFGQNLQNAELGNQANAQGFSEAQAVQNQPINQLAALRNLTQIQNPQVSAPTNSPINPVDLAGIVNNNYTQKIGSYNNKINGLFGLAGAGLMAGGMAAGGGGGAAMAASDVRLKKDIKRVGTLKSGIGAYEFTYRNDPTGTRHTGALAQEVELVIPAAVITDSDGYKRVNYSMVR